MGAVTLTPRLGARRTGKAREPGGAVAAATIMPPLGGRRTGKAVGGGGAGAVVPAAAAVVVWGGRPVDERRAAVRVYRTQPRRS